MDDETKKAFDKMYEVALKAGENTTLDFHQPRNLAHDSDSEEDDDKKKKRWQSKAVSLIKTL